MKRIFCNAVLLFICLRTTLIASASSDLGRIETYNTVSKHLESLSETQLSQILEIAEPLHSKWATALKIKVGQTTVFVKKLPLTTLENRSENYRSTSNLFKLPTYYQYGIGSAGFSAWRELQAHIITTDWVISGECPNFPIMYHWRLLPNKSPSPISEENQKKIDKAVIFWGGSQAIRSRLEALQQPPASILLFVEYIPQMAKTWLVQQLSLGNEQSLEMVEENLLAVTSFMNARGMLHFDANFENILTDGNRLYFTDFGLVLSSEFALSDAELDFFNKHKNYDRYSTMAHFTYSIITTLHGKKNWKEKLKEHTTSKLTKSLAQKIINRYMSITFTMEKFYQSLRKDKSTPYPVDELDRLWINNLQRVNCDRQEN